MPIEPAVRHLVDCRPSDPTHRTSACVPAGRYLPHDIDALIDDRKLVRIAALRATVHLLTAQDALALRPSFSQCSTGN